MKLVARAPGKVNLCLFVGALRGDRRHELVTLLESVSLADEVELVTRVALEDQVVCDDVHGPNLAARALAGLRGRGWDAPRVRITIHKRIPIAAGMGGGSADAAATLRLACRLSPVSREVVDGLAAELGADVPGQLDPGLVVATGAGEVVAPAWPRRGLPAHAVLILPAAEQLSTADVYEQADRLGGLRSSAELASLRERLMATLNTGDRPPDALLVNDLQPAALSLCPRIHAALDAAREAGAEHAFVCGSGPTVAGLYWGDDAASRAAFAAASLADRWPRTQSAVPVPRGYGFPAFA